jgi:probable aminopeptidase NPEPL1
MAALASASSTDMCAKPCCTLRAEGDALQTTGRAVFSFGFFDGEGRPVRDFSDEADGDDAALRDVLIVGFKPALVAALASDAGRAFFDRHAHGQAMMLSELAESCRPGREVTHAAIKETHAIVHGVIRKVVLCALPTMRSRHNCPASPHAVTDFVRSKSGGANAVTVVCVLADPAHGLASGLAAARAFSRFSAKQAYGGLRSMGGRGGTGVRDYGGGDGETAVGADGGSRRPVRIALLGCDARALSDLSRLPTLADSTALAARIVDAPTNLMHTHALVAEARAVFEEARKKMRARGDGSGRVELTVLRGEQLRERGLGLLWGVGKAAVHKPALVVLSLIPDPPAAEPGAARGGGAPPGASTALVGKGIVYDTGGLSIKGKTFMPGMKRDCGGAAACLGAWRAAALAPPGRLRGPLHALLCLAENAVGPASTRPDDVHVGFSNRTVEINNTDAEGRLVLGDGVAYAATELGCDRIFTCATLTGAQGIATGKRHCAVYTNDGAWEASVCRLGRRTGELAHPVPFCPEFWRHEFRSAVADMTNNVKDRGNAQVSCAAQFIFNHLPDQGWEEGNDAGRVFVHLDIAFPSFDKSSERATGFGVALLSHMAEQGKTPE